MLQTQPVDVSPQERDRVTNYFETLVQSVFRDKIRTIAQFHNYVYEVLWKYYLGVIPRNYNTTLPSTIYKIDLKMVTTNLGVTNLRISVKGYTDVVVGIPVANHLRQQIATMAKGSVYKFGVFTNRENQKFSISTFSDIQSNFNDKWTEWVYNPVTYIDKLYTASTDKDVYECFRDLYYTTINTNVNLFSVVILTSINTYNGKVAYPYQINKYHLTNYDRDRCCMDLILKTRSGKSTTIFLHIPLGLQEYVYKIHMNLTDMFDAVFEWYDKDDSFIPDKTIQSIGNALFPIANSYANYFDQIPYLSTGKKDMGSMSEVLKEVKVTKPIQQPKVQEQPQETPKPHTNTREEFSAKVKALLSGRITDRKTFGSESALIDYCCMAIDTVYEVSTTTNFRYNVRVFKRINRDKYHTLNVLVYDDSGILVSYSTKILLEYNNMYQSKGSVVFIDGDSTNCVQRKTNVVQETLRSVTEFHIADTLYKQHPSISVDGFKYRITKSIFTKDADKLIYENTGHRFNIWEPTTDGSACYLVVDVYLRIDLVRSYVFKVTKDSSFSVISI